MTDTKLNAKAGGKRKRKENGGKPDMDYVKIILREKIMEKLKHKHSNGLN